MEPKERRDNYLKTANNPLGGWLHDFRLRIASGVQVIETVTTEPNAVYMALSSFLATQKAPTQLWNWTVTSGLTFLQQNVAADAINTATAFCAIKGHFNDEIINNDPKVMQPFTFLHAHQCVAQYMQQNAREMQVIYLVENMHWHFGDPRLRQEFERLAKGNLFASATHRGHIVLLQCPYPHESCLGVMGVKHFFTSMPFPLPDEEEILRIHVDYIADKIAASGSKENGAEEAKDPHLRRAIAKACLGLERATAEDIIAFAIRSKGKMSKDVPNFISKEVAKRLADTSSLEVIPEESIRPPEELGGVDNIIRELEYAADTYTDEAKAQFIDPALGIWAAGFSGTGKTEIAKTTSVIFQRRTERAWKTIRVRMGGFYGGLVGDTEKNWYDFERRIAAMGECIIFMDEMDKAFGGSDTGNSTRRSLLGLLLTWLSDHTKRGNCFVILAMNSPAGIPPELTQRGRVGNGFFFDLPSYKARTEIVKIHFSRRLKLAGMSLDDLGFKAADWNTIGEATDKWTPAELEELVKRSRSIAFQDRRKALPVMKEVLDAIRVIGKSIMSIQKAAELEELRKSCEHAMPVCGEKSEQQNKTKTGKKNEASSRVLDFDN